MHTVKLALLGLTAAATIALSVIALNPPMRAESTSTYVKPTTTATPAAAPPPSAVFIGDSYTAGAGSSDPAQLFPTIVGKAQGWAVTNLGRGGTGYLAASGPLGCGLDYCPNYREMIEAAKDANPSIIIVSGGRNDLNMTGLYDQVSGFYADLRASFPDATIRATAPLWDDDEPAPELEELGAQVKSAVESVGGEYLEIGQPIVGNPDLVSADGIHPNDAGYAAIATAVIEQYI